MAGTRTRTGKKGRRAAVRRRARRSGRGWPLLLVAFVLAASAAGFWWWRSGGSVSEVARRIGVPEVLRPRGWAVTLYFADPRWTRLVPETRTLRQPAEGSVAAIEALVKALADGPRDGAAPVLPAGARLRAAYLGTDGVAVLDFDPGGLAGFEPGGVAGELLTVFAVVHTVAENVDGITAVQILVGGEARETLSGHVKISEPLGPNADLLGER